MPLFEIRDSDLVHHGIHLADISLFALVQETNPDTPFAIYYDDMHMAYRAKCVNKPSDRLAHNVMWHEVTRLKC